MKNLDYSLNSSILITSLMDAQRNQSKLLNLILIAVYVIIFTIGFISNFLVIYFVSVYKRMQTMTNKFLINLAIADLLVVLICVPVTIGRLYKPHEYIFGEFICKCSPFVQGISVSVSILTLTVISADRYYIIYKPFKARVNCTNNKIKIIVSFIWAISIFIMSPLLIVNKIQSPFKNWSIFLNIELQICVEEWPYYEIRLAYDGLLFVVLFIIPIVFILYAYITISHVLWNVEENLIEDSIGVANMNVNRQANPIAINRASSMSSNVDLNNSVKLEERIKLNTFISCKDVRNDKIELKILESESLKPAASINSFIGSASSIMKPSKDSGNTQSFQCNSQTNLATLTVQYSGRRSDPKLNIRTYCSIPSINNTSSRNNKRALSMRNQMNNLIKSRRRIVKLLIVLVILFVISWLPYHTISLLIEILHYIEILNNHNSTQFTNSSLPNLDVDNINQRKAYEILSEFVHPVTLCLALANSATNPVCYCILSHGFRKMFQINFFKFKKALTCSKSAS